nr:hypothetical protein [uncultured Cupriavidus sp.]
MRRLAGRLALLFALVLLGADAAWASDIACPLSYQTHSRNDLRVPGRKLICEYAMLNHAYEAIHADQQRRLRAGTLRRNDLQAWRRKRDACGTVKCVDAVFAEWNRTASAQVARGAPPAKMVKVPDDKVSKGAGPSPPVPPAWMAPVVVQSTIEPRVVTLRESLPPLPLAARRSYDQRAVQPHRPLLPWGVWLGALLMAMGALGWFVVRRRPMYYRAVALTTLAWLQRLPMLMVILGGLAFLNGLLLLILLGS